MFAKRMKEKIKGLSKKGERGHEVPMNNPRDAVKKFTEKRVSMTKSGLPKSFDGVKRGEL